MTLAQKELEVSQQSPQEEKKLKRALKSRHLTMISIGGAIGTGLFLGSGASISQAGPGGALFAYIFIGAMVNFVMTSLGELSAFMPTSGAFSTYGSKLLTRHLVLLWDGRIGLVGP